jgi:hypothetical protein
MKSPAERPGFLLSHHPRIFMQSVKTMAYEIHITRRAPDAQILPIALSEWCAAVQQTPGVRMANGDYEIANPKSGETIRLRNAGGDAEAFFSTDANWLRVFRWSPRGDVSFRAPRDFDLPTCEIRSLPAELARALGESLIRDEGEIYD